MKRLAFAVLVATALAEPAGGNTYDELNVGIQYYNLGQWSEVVAHLDTALAAGDLVPSLQFIAHYDRARANLILSHHDQALADYSASLAIRPDEPQVLIERSLLYMGTGKLDLAESDLNSAIAAHPLLSDSYNSRAMLNIWRGQLDKSREDMKAALKLLPEKTRSRIAIGVIDWNLGQIDDAETNFYVETNNGLNRRYAWLWYTLAELRLGKSVPRRSLPDYDHAAWPAPITAFFLGDVTQAQVFTAAQQGSPGQIKGQICEANFYISEWLLQHHDQAGAKPLMSKAAAECPMGFIEWSPAHMDLAGLQ